VISSVSSRGEPHHSTLPQGIVELTFLSVEVFRRLRLQFLHMNKGLLVVVVSALCSLPSQAQTKSERLSPSLEETYEWLRGHLNQFVVIPFNGTRSVQVETVAKCQVTISDTWTSTDPKEPAHAWRVVIPLSDLDPDHHRLEPFGPVDAPSGWFLHIGTRTGAEDIVQCRLDDPKCEHYRAKWPEFDLPFKQRDVAERASKAFHHATLLCGGRAAAF